METWLGRYADNDTEAGAQESGSGEEGFLSEGVMLLELLVRTGEFSQRKRITNEITYHGYNSLLFQIHFCNLAQILFPHRDSTFKAKTT